MSDSGMPTLAAFTQEKTNAAAEATRRQINTNPFVNGVWLKGVEVPTGGAGIEVAHNLRAVPQGYIVTKSSAANDVYAPTGSMTAQSLRFYNNSGSTITVDVWVF